MEEFWKCFQSFWDDFSDIFFGWFSGRISVNFGPVLDPIGILKTAKNVERYVDLAFLRFFVRLVLEDRFRKHFELILAPKNSQNRPKNDRKNE